MASFSSILAKPQVILTLKISTNLASTFTVLNAAKWLSAIRTIASSCLGTFLHQFWRFAEAKLASRWWEWWPRWCTQWPRKLELVSWIRRFTSSLLRFHGLTDCDIVVLQHLQVSLRFEEMEMTTQSNRKVEVSDRCVCFHQYTAKISRDMKWINLTEIQLAKISDLSTLFRDTGRALAATVGNVPQRASE